MGLLNFLPSSSSLLITLITISCNFDFIRAQADNNNNEYGMCGDPDCTEPLGIAKAFSLYNPSNSYALRLQPGEAVVVYVRDCGPGKKYLGVELNGRKGYVPKNIVRETKSFMRAKFPAKTPFVQIVNKVPDTSTQIASSPTAVASDEPQSISSHTESHSTTTSDKTPESSQSQQIPSASPNAINSSPTTEPHISHSTYVNSVPASSTSPSHISNSKQTSVSQDNIEHSPKHPISRYKEVLSKQINATLDTMVEHQKSQHAGSSDDIKPTEPTDQNAHQSDQDYLYTLQKMKKMGMDIDEYDLNSTDSQSQFSDSSITTTTKLVDVTPSSSSFHKQSATSGENVPTSQTMLFPSHSPSYSKPSKSKENEQIASDANAVPVDPQSVTSKPGILPSDTVGNDKNVDDNEHVGNVDENVDDDDDDDDSDDYYDDSEHKSETFKVHKDKNDPLLSSVVESITRTLASNQLDSTDESQFKSVTDSNKLENEKFSDESNSNSIKTPPSENPAGYFTEASQTVEVKSSFPSTFSTNEVSADQMTKSFDPTHSNLLSDAYDLSANQTHAEEDFSLNNAIDDATSRAYDSSSHTSSRHILGDDSRDDDISISTMDGNHAHTANLESGAGDHPGYFSVGTIEWAAGSFWNASANFVYGLKAFLDLIIAWSPEPLHSSLKNMNVYGMSARAVVFTALSVVPTFLLFALVTYIQRNSKESCITAQLCEAERKLYQSSAERNALLEENNNLREQFESAEKSLVEDRSISSEMKGTVEALESQYKQAKLEVKSHQEKLLRLSRENEDLQKKLADSRDKYERLSECLRTQENDMSSLSEANEKMQDELDQLSTEKQQLLASEELYKEKISSLEQSCKQLLQEAEIWNARVSELTEQVYSEATAKKEAENSIQSKDSEIETLKTVISSMEALTNTKESEEGDKKSLEESMQLLMDAGKIQIQLKKSEELSESLSEKLKQERNKVLEMEVELLESKSEVDKLKVQYNQALQDKAEAQTKLDVLTKYFKDKELQLQKELGVQEAFRQRKEEDATQAERRIHLIEEENSSYKFQVATLKQEIEETERNLKNQIANQEKKAHENWLAARNAERKMDEMKQENTQFRQRLTLLEREQEKWSTSSQGDVVRPVPQRVSEQGHDILSANDGNIPVEFLPRHIPPPPRHPDDMIPPFPPSAHLPMPLPGRPILPPPSHSPRPLPPPMMPPFIPRPPFDPVLSGMPPHRPVPWNTMTEKRFDLERRKMPSDFDSPSSRRNQTPPRSDSSRRSVSPTDFNSRSRSSSPSVPLPDFHNTPPRMGRPDMPPPPPHMRFVGGPPPPHLMHRRDFNSGALPFRDGNRDRSERLSDEGGNSGSRTRNFSQPRQASEEEV